MNQQASLHDGFLRGHHHSDSPRGTDERFASEAAVRQTPSLQFDPANPDGKLFLGVVDAQIKTAERRGGGRDRYTVGGQFIGVGDDRHIITVAGSRAGKGRAVLVPNLLAYPGSVLVIDPKGELARLTARYRAEQMGQQVHVLDPFDAVGGYASQHHAIFNPLTMLDPTSRTLLEDAGLIADALIIPSGGNDPHWDDSARNLVEGLVLHVATWSGYEDRRDLIQVYELLGQALKRLPESDLFELEAEMGQNTAAGGAVMDSARDFYERADKERESVLSTVRRHLHFLAYEPMQDVLAGQSLDLTDLKTKQTTIYLTLPAMRMGTCSRWLRLFVNLTLAAMENVQAKPKHPVLLCLDEFAVLGPMKTIEDAAGQIAGLGCRLWPILQDLGQLKALYKDRWETFMGNAGVLQFFGNSDLTTLEWIAKRLGQTTVLHKSQSNTTYDAAVKSGATGKSWSVSTQELVTAAEAARFFGRDDKLLRQLVIRPTFPAMVLQRAYYDKHELFRGRYERDAV